MKKSFLLMGALCMGAMFVSCIDDEETPQVTAMRQAQADNTYIKMYTTALDEIKTLEADLATNQAALDDLKDGLITAKEASDILVKYYTGLVNVAESEKAVRTKSGYDYQTLSDFGNDSYAYDKYKYQCEETWGEYINGLKENIDEAKNAYTDVNTLIKMYENVIAEIKNEIAFQHQIADRAYDYFDFQTSTTTTPSTSTEE